MRCPVEVVFGSADEQGSVLCNYDS